MNSINKALVQSLSIIALTSTTQLMAQETTWSVETGLGYETNIYHAPDHDYLDTALPSNRPGANPPGTPLAISPEAISSFFIPVDVSAGIINKVYENTDFVAEIDFDTDLIMSSEAEDATRTNSNLSMGLDFELIEWKYSKKKKDHIKKKRGKAYIGMFISTHDQVYVDRDSGDPKTTSGGLDLSDKYSYQSAGVEGNYERKAGKYEYLFGFHLEDLNYETPESGAEYDHKYQKYELGLKRNFSKSTDMKLMYIYSDRDYSDRHSRDVLTGTYSSNNDLLVYTYNTIKLALGHRFDSGLKTYFDIKNVVRTDEFEAYNDYNKFEISLRARYKYSDKTKIRAKIRSTDTDYDNAYNFDDSTRGNKQNSGTDVSFKIEHDINKHQSYYVEYDFTDRVSTDDRYDYTNNVILAGAKWEY